MFAVYKMELKAGIKSMLIWAVSVGILGLICILLFKSMEESMAEMAKSMAALGLFAKAFGMDILSIATMKGFFATEVGTLHSLGGAMFAASIAAVILSKEEEGHTAEFTFTLPLSRSKIIVMKYLAVLTHLVCFSLICTVCYLAGFLFLGEQDMGGTFYQYMIFQLLMDLEIASIGFLISAVSRRNRLGAGISLAMVFYAFDMMARVIPAVQSCKFLTPFSFSNATDIFSGSSIDIKSLILGMTITLLTTASAWYLYCKKDLAG